ncbi:Wound-responsive family protein [Fagus crenata]
MSLRYMSRILYQSGMRVIQGMKDQASKCDSTVNSLVSLRDSSYSSSANQARRFSRACDSAASKAAANRENEKVKLAEESLRIVMYLSCWGPN